MAISTGHGKGRATRCQIIMQRFSSREMSDLAALAALHITNVDSEEDVGVIFLLRDVQSWDIDVRLQK